MNGLMNCPSPDNAARQHSSAVLTGQGEVPGNELPGYSHSSLRDKKMRGIGSPAMNCRAIFISPYGTKNPFLSPIRVDDVMNCRAVLSRPHGTVFTDSLPCPF